MTKSSLWLRLNHLHQMLPPVEIALHQLTLARTHVTTDEGRGYIDDKMAEHEVVKEWLEQEILVCEIGLGFDDGDT